MSHIIDETLKTERERGMYHFLMPYAQASRPFVMQPSRSLFLDGEVGADVAARRLVEEKEAYRGPLRQRGWNEMVRRMEARPRRCAAELSRRVLDVLQQRSPGCHADERPPGRRGPCRLLP